MRVKPVTVGKFQCLYLALFKFRFDEGFFRASALTFYSVLSIVPVLAVCFGIAKGFGFDLHFKQYIETQLVGHTEIMEWVIGTAERLLEQTKGELIGGLGFFILLISVFKILGHIESSLNKIWKITGKRRLDKRLSQYLSLLLIGPSILALTSSMTLLLANEIHSLSKTSDIALLSELDPILSWGASIAPFVIMFFFLSWIYYFVPYTRIKLSSALFGGFVASFLFYWLQWAIINLQIDLLSYGAIYGSLAALPIALIWLQCVWAILFYGAEVSYIHQNRLSQPWEIIPHALSHRSERLFATKIVHYCVERLTSHKPPLNLVEIADRLSVPPALIEPIINKLLREKLLVELTPHDGQRAFQPAIDVDSLTLKAVINKLETSGVNKLSKDTTEALYPMGDYLELFEERLNDWPYHVPLNTLPKNVKLALEEFKKNH